MNTTLATERLEELEAEAPDALRLARLASLAVRVERHLLRRLRLELLPGMDVGSEADLWFSPVIESRGSGSFVIDAAVALLLRRDLARESETFERAANITEVEHRHLPASIRLEEQVHAISARGGDDVLVRIDDAMAPALRALREGGERGKEVACWAMRALPRFDPVVRESARALALLLGASALLGGRRIVRERTSSRASLNQLAWAIPAAALSKRVRVDVEVTDNAVRFIDDAGDRPVLELPSTIPRLVEASWTHGDAEIVNLIEADIGNVFQLDPGVSALTLRSLDGNEYLLQKQSAERSPRPEPPEAEKGTCFVVMGFGKKTDFETGRVLDLDQSYKNLIKPAVEAAGLKCIRADEIVHSGLIDVPMYELLLKADVVVADLSTSNRVAIYELGVRHALRPYTTLVIAEEMLMKSRFFDLHHIVIRNYRHLGEDIGMSEIRRFSAELTSSIKQILATEPKLRWDSPVYKFIEKLTPPSIAVDEISRREEFVPPVIESEAEKGTCYVVMGFGKKTDFETGRVLDLDQSYKNLIKPAVEAAGLKCIRADEIVHSGLIDVPMYELLLKADVVVADLSTSNRAAIYELGVRHALRPYTTLVIAEEMLMKSPFFDLHHIVIRNYRHLGEDIGVSEIRRFSAELTSSIKQILAKEPKLRWDSPVYKFIEKLTPPAIAEKAATGTATGSTSASHSQMMQRVDEAQRKGDWLKAKVLLDEIREMRKSKGWEIPGDQQAERPEDPYILQRLSLATYKSKYPSPEQALKEARDLLALLDPQTSNDTETLHLWGSVHKQLWELTKDESHLDEAVRAYERGFHLRHDYYNGINLAFPLNVRAVNTGDSKEARADFAEAGRARKEVVQICEDWLAANSTPDGQREDEAKYWVLATLAEAHYGLGENDAAEQRLAEARAIASADWMKRSTEDQLAKLRQLLENSSSSRIPVTPVPGVEKGGGALP